MQTLRSVVLLAFVALPCTAAEPQARLQFKASGFSIAPLEGESDDTPYQAVIMFLPATEGFAPNVNVQVQPYDGTLKDYATLSQQQFKAGGFTVLSEKTAETTVAWEYSGTLQNRKLHWYSRAVQGKGKVYLVTATCTESGWMSMAEKLKNCVDSIKVEDAEQTPEPGK